MKFFKFVFLAVVCSVIAASVRLVMFGRPQAAESLQGDSSASVEVAQESPGVDKSAQVEPGLPRLAQERPGVDNADQAAQDNQVPPLQVVGYVKRGHAINLWLSDGRFLTERDQELTEVRKNYAVISGQRVWFVRPVARVQTDQAGRSEAERGLSTQSGSDALGVVLGSGPNSPVK